MALRYDERTGEFVETGGGSRRSSGGSSNSNRRSSGDSSNSTAESCGEKIGQGKVNAANYLKENEAVSSEIEKLIREQLMHSDKYEGDIGGYDDSENQVDADIPPMEDEPF